MKIQIITLPDCNRCNKLKKDLSDNSIFYRDTSCDDNPNQCDSLESLLGIEEYPMILITDKQDNILEILYIAKNYEMIGKNKDFDGGVIGIPMHSIDSMVHYVKNKLN
jgi:glutaredoxin